LVTNPDSSDVMTLRCDAHASSDLAMAIGETVRDVTKLRAAVELVAAGSLPNDGKVIADERKYD
jgi:phenylacetate-CoA ligase